MNLSTAIYLVTIAILLADGQPKSKRAGAARIVLVLAAIAVAVMSGVRTEELAACPCSPPHGDLAAEIEAAAVEDAETWLP